MKLMLILQIASENPNLKAALKTCIVGSTEAPSEAFLLFFLLPDWLKLNHLKRRMECGFSDIFSRRREKMFRKPHLKLLR